MNTQLTGMMRIVSPLDIIDEKVSFRTNGGIIADKRIKATQDIKVGRRLYVDSNIFSDVRFIDTQTFNDTKECATTLFNTAGHDIEFNLNINAINNLIQSFTNFNGPYNVNITCTQPHVFNDQSTLIILEPHSSLKLVYYDSVWYNIT